MPGKQSSVAVSRQTCLLMSLPCAGKLLMLVALVGNTIAEHASCNRQQAMASPSPRSREHIVLQFTNLGVNFTCQNTSGCEVRIIACIRYSRSGTVEKFQGNCRNCKATFHRQVRGFVRQGDMLGQVHRNDDFSKKCTITLPLPEEYETDIRVRFVLWLVNKDRADEPIADVKPKPIPYYVHKSPVSQMWCQIPGSKNGHNIEFPIFKYFNWTQNNDGKCSGLNYNYIISVKKEPHWKLALEIALPIAATGILIAVVVIFTYRRISNKHAQLAETQERLMDNVHDLGRVVNGPKPDREKRPRFGSAFFSNPPSFQVLPKITAAALPPRSHQSRHNLPNSSSRHNLPNSSSGHNLPNSSRKCEARVARETGHQRSPPLAYLDGPAYIPGYKSYEPPTVVVDQVKMTTSPAASSTEQNEDTLTPLTEFNRHFPHRTTDGSPKSLSADHATGGTAKSEVGLGEKVVCSERCDSHVQARALRSTDSQSEIYSHVLGQQCRPDSTSALRRSNLILM